MSSWEQWTHSTLLQIQLNSCLMAHSLCGEYIYLHLYPLPTHHTTLHSVLCTGVWWIDIMRLRINALPSVVLGGWLAAGELLHMCDRRAQLQYRCSSHHTPTQTSLLLLLMVPLLWHVVCLSVNFPITTYTHHPTKRKSI